ncbi:uncharacterized protein LOC131428594 [Malaya genurostris]|uniref:uncharacterized protein LOC131428594 n=1 Tax=Malaya genurostris TaxID=325434 RepID=UPI0026F40471|nr:uncharacterized protein LOC131428594 [Malaya genurostris]
MGASNGFLIAIAIPLDIPGRNIYLSHNFEMNYGLPTNASQYRLWYTLFKKSKYNIPEAIARKRRMADATKLSRKFVYELIAERMNMYGYNGTACVHKAICETMELPFHTNNGVYGDVTHIVFRLSNMFRTLFVILFLLYGTASAHGDDRISNSSEGKILHREKRIVFTFNSATGILVALSIPLIIPGRNIFMSYNFEMNYNMPTDSTDYTQGVLKRIETPEINTRDLKENEHVQQVRRSATFTRKKAYRSLELRLNKMGFNGKRCVLRAICEASDVPMYEHNGILGDLIQILLTPSHSADENLPPEFHRAEELGHRHDCSKYRRHCSKSILDLISVLV